MSPSVPPLGEGDVHVWRIPLEPDEDWQPRLRAILAPEELRRADRFRLALHGRRFTAGRGALRALLGAYLGVAPPGVVFRYGTHGKPRVEGLEFNLAHTDDLALCAVSREGTLGIDVERIRPIDTAERIIERYFTPAEQAEFLAHGEADRSAAFFRGWTRKEAFLKATGDGLAAALDSFEVSLSARGAALLRVGDDPDAARRWTMRDIDAGPGHLAALAIDRGVTALTHLDWRWR